MAVAVRCEDRQGTEIGRTGEGRLAGNTRRRVACRYILEWERICTLRLVAIVPVFLISGVVSMCQCVVSLWLDTVAATPWVAFVVPFMHSLLLPFLVSLSRCPLWCSSQSTTRNTTVPCPDCCLQWSRRRRRLIHHWTGYRNSWSP